MSFSEKVILGVDPGLINTGWGIIKCKKDQDIHILNGTITTNSKDDLAVRLNHIYEELMNIVKAHSPENIAVEKIFANVNPKTSIKLGKARGLVFLVAARNRLKISEYAPNTIKKNLVGYGHASKNQIVKMLKRIYPNATIHSDDSADALAVAICHSMQTQSKLRII